MKVGKILQAFGMFLKFSRTVEDMFLLELNGIICCVLIRYVITSPSASKNLANIYFCIYLLLYE